MQNKKEKFIEKIVQKDYNNKLENIFETKNFDENVKNLLLEILYKIEASYRDYKIVKRDVNSKQQYIEELIKTIKNDCDEIKIITPNSKEAASLGGRTFTVDKENKKIVCYPIERKLLYSIFKISKRDRIVRKENHIISETMSDLINIGNNINAVEPLRDFNGWSWFITRQEIENITYNLLYQNLIILVGNEFLNRWVQNKEYIIDYYSEFKEEFQSRYGQELSEKMVQLLEQLSIIVKSEINEEFYERISKEEENLKKELDLFENKQEFIETITKEKKEINKKIKELEKIISDKKLLEEEYKKRNESLSLENKIFSKKVLEKKLKEEKLILVEKLNEKNSLLNPVKYIKEKEKLQKKYDLIKIATAEDKIKEKQNLLEEFESLFLKSFLTCIEKAKTKEELIELIYKFRYYNMLPINETMYIHNIKVLEKQIKKIEEKLLKKAIDLKIINLLIENEKENFKVLQTLFRTRIIELEKIYILIKRTKDKYYVEFSEENSKSVDEKIEIKLENKQEIKIKLNKKIKLFN